MENYITKIQCAENEDKKTSILIEIWNQVKNDKNTIPLELYDFIKIYEPTEWIQFSLIGLIMWEYNGYSNSAPFEMLIRIFPGLFEDEYPEIQEEAKLIFRGIKATDFLSIILDNDLFDLNSDDTIKWYSRRIIANFTKEACEYFDKNR